ncbi:DPP IV N-terminal domain-containing protein, partial [Bacteroidota bacterium]
QNKVYYSRVNPKWLDNSDEFWYLRNTPEGNEFIMIDPEKRNKQPAFNHKKLAVSLSKASGIDYEQNNLPLTSINFSDGKKDLLFNYNGYKWTCNLRTYKCEKGEKMPERNRDRRYWGESRDELDNDPVVSPDSLWEAYVEDYNVYIRSKKSRKEFKLSYDGSPGEYYSSYIKWSPDSKKLVTNRILPGFKRLVHYVESSPRDQLQPKHSTREYTKPGDALTQKKPKLFLVDTKKKIDIDESLYMNQFSLNNIKWWEDSRAFSFEFNQRGHQVYRVIEVDAVTGEVRNLIDEEAKTFIDYSGKKYRYDVSDGKEIIWASERDGWNHLYLYSGITGKLKNQITKGNWVVRGVVNVNELERTITFRASGREKGQDPYFIHYYRINFDGNGLIKLSEGNGNHNGIFSPDKKYFVDTWSRVDEAPVSVLRSSVDGKEIMKLEKADISKLLEKNWKTPEVFVSKARDGITDIWGIIIRPLNFDPEKKYPVIEYIYAGPHSSFVPKSFREYNSMQALAELGFILVQIDGMGTSNRSKAFHDVCWQNLGDAGFPDRILWIKEAAKKYPYMDISKVGIYGTSAGGQSSTGAVLFHPEFYKVAVSSCGCHDNRMDKIWWNEQWMGYPVGPHYAASSNVDNAHKLKGKLFLIVGEMDSNVDPASTMQVVDALVKANKDFDLLVVPGMGHSGGGKFGERKRRDFFVKHLLGVNPPDWNSMEE